MFHPEGAALIGDIIFEMIAHDTDVQYIGGREIGAIPMAVSVAARSWPDRPINAFFVRKAPKDQRRHQPDRRPVRSQLESHSVRGQSPPRAAPS